MERYSNKSGNSGVTSYEIGESYIRVKFNGNPKIYQYSYDGRVGKTRVENMKRLARSGSGLNYVKYLYDK